MLSGRRTADATGVALSLYEIKIEFETLKLRSELVAEKALVGKASAFVFYLVLIALLFNS